MNWDRQYWESSTKISKFYAPTDSEHKFDKTEIENQLKSGIALIENP